LHPNLNRKHQNARLARNGRKIRKRFFVLEKHGGRYATMISAFQTGKPAATAKKKNYESFYQE
jgi:hypothetical protein